MSNPTTPTISHNENDEENQQASSNKGCKPSSVEREIAVLSQSSSDVAERIKRLEIALQVGVANPHILCRHADMQIAIIKTTAGRSLVKLKFTVPLDH